MKRTKKIFIYLIILNLYLTLTKIDLNTKIKTEFTKNKFINYNSLELFIGNNNDFEDSQMFHFDFGYSKLLLGDIKRTNWGIECKNEINLNTCEKKNEEIKISNYNLSKFAFIDSKIFFRFKINEKIDNMGKKVDFSLIEENTDKWPLDENGVVGLSPKSEFGNYLRNNFENDISFLFYFYYEKNDKVKSDLLNFKSIVLMNPYISAANIVFQVDFDNKNEFWNFEANFEIENTNIIFKNKNICITNNVSDLIIMKDNIKICDSIKKIACNNKIGNNCKKNNVNLKKLPKLIFEINNKKLKILGKDYIYFTNENILECRFGNLENLKSLNTCDENSEFAVGKVFLSKFYPVFIFNKDNTSTLIMLDYYNFDQKSDFYWLYISFIFFIIISPFFYIIYKNKKKSDNEVYSKV